MRTHIHIGVIDLNIFLGIFLGFMLAWFFLRNANKEKIANLYQGLFLLALTFGILEEFLNNTGLIVKVLEISNFAEPLNFAYGPLLYLFVKRSMHPLKNTKKDWIHFIIFFLYLLYMTFYFVQPETVKYNSYIYSKHPDWQILHANPVVSDDPLGIRNYINTLTAIHFVLYLALTVSILWIRKPADKENMNDFNLKKLQSLKFSTIHFVIILVIFVSTKLYFGRDLGDHFIAIYITLMFFITTLQIIQYSTYFQTTHSFLEVPVKKYSKSSLDEKRKNELLASIKHEMEKNKFYADPLASLSNLAKRLHETNHHISQVINEKMNKTFYELLASCRIEEAKKILVNPQNAHLTVEEIAEKVGYNSKSAFNNAFKKLTGKTPSAFRKTRE